jgi:hypothetical protein
MSFIVAIKKKKHTSGSQPQRTVMLSQILPNNFVESVLTLDAAVINDDAYYVIQAVLNGGNIHLIWDKSVSLSSTLFIESDTTITVSTNKGAVLRNGVNKCMFRNKNMIFSSHSAIVDKHILIDGGIWNGNAYGQTVKGTSTYGFVHVFCWYGVEDVIVQNHKIYTPKAYAQHAANVLYGHILDFVVDVGATPSVNMDGIHFDGGCSDCSIKRGVIKTEDDGIGLNADDRYRVSEVQTFFPLDINAPISNIVIEDIVFNNSLFGIRIMSGQSRVDNIQIKNISGSTANYSLIIDNYWQGASTLDKPGAGNIGSVTVDNVTTTVPDRNPGYVIHKGKINLSASIESLIMTNITGSGNPSIPQIYKAASGGGYTYAYGTIMLNGSPA